MDDEEIVRDVVVAVLEELGYEVETAKDGEEAVAVYRRAQEEGRTIDAVILDLTVPGGVGGKGTLAALKEIDPNVKAIVSSGYSDDPIMADFRGYGFSGVVKKPFQVQELARVLNTVLGGPGRDRAAGGN